MNGRSLRPSSVAAAAVAIGGVFIVALPQHAASTIQIVIVTVAVAAGLRALAVHVPPTGWLSPFKWMAPFNRPIATHAGTATGDRLRTIRVRLSGPRQRVEGGPPLPPATVRLLKPLITAALELDGRDQPLDESVRGLVSPATYAVLAAEPLHRPPWYRTLPPNRRAVAGAVHHILDDLDRLRGRDS